ncbi:MULTISPECIES: SPFH domain-containing protein [Fischerella]|jgi:regulator of protease activity HflC (stomatin/prohibitin superfamily)|uniref:Band 7 protein n=3 Tax=Fischerella TaxID=1190 RepID=G6FNE3_9CYAN|nr:MULTISPECIES: SPFH domain-containing protein [Fischerella]PMB05933.1 SPFH/Band 7/PHB domain protein [Fischerella thermalis CCMEE 5328]PMB08261.1 SPFH/Band 7/PHB domain protein [Fischerella thermalis CCMEE 5273]RDH48213.1 paraslipin [Mastigocladus laminosus WC112]BCX08396.1 MAG: paraslipin [Fischerella sp.]EHC19573.1 band 7 protein [Fischerella thermalis JSC-11]
MEPIIAIVLVLMGYALGSAKLINEGNEALVERLGKYHRKLDPGLNFIIPLLDQIVMEDTTREQILDIKPQNIITKDNIYVEIDAVLFWRIQDIKKSYYEIEDLQTALSQLATTTIREILAQHTLEETNVLRSDMDRAILDSLNAITPKWGVEVLRVDIQSITLPESVRKSMEEQRAAEIKSRAAILEAEGERQAAVKKAEGTKRSMEIIAEALRDNPGNKDILRYLVAQDYINASYRLGESENAKVVFVDPGKSADMMELIAQTVSQEGNNNKSENGSV